MVGASSLSAYIYIYHLGLNFNLPTVPDSLNDNLGIQFEATPVLGRSAPQQTFSSAGPRSLQVQLKFHRQIFALENPQLATLTTTQKVKMPDPQTGRFVEYKASDAADVLINALQALALPKYMDAVKAIVPPSLLLRFGNEIAIRGVPSQFQKQTSGPWLKSGKQADVAISFTVTEVEPYSAQYVAQNGGLRGLSTTLERSSVWQW